jgi:AcrR family transcriptional regulator
MSTRAATKQQTKEALLQAGMALFAEQGLDGPSLDAICERAGYTRGAFYVHFRDRDDFLVAVMERVGGDFLDAVIGAGLEPTVQRFVASLASGLYPLTRRGGVRPYQLYDACARSPAIRARYVEILRLAIAKLAVVVEDEQRGGGRARAATRGDRVAGAPADVAALLLALAIGAHTMLDLELPLDYAGLAQTAVALLTGRAARGRPRRETRRLRK